MCYVLFPLAENGAKLQLIFVSPKLFVTFFLRLIFSAGTGTAVPKSECKGSDLYRNHQIFLKVFQEKFQEGTQNSISNTHNTLSKAALDGIKIIILNPIWLCVYTYYI